MLFLYIFAYCFIVIMIDYIYHNIGKDSYVRD